MTKSCWRRTTLPATRTPSECSVVGAKPAISAMERAATARPVSLCALVPKETWCNRMSGFGSPMGNEMRYGATWLPSEEGSSLSSMTLMGTRASSCGFSTGPRVCNHERRPPLNTARTTSLMVQLWATRNALRSASANWVIDTRRCSDTVPTNGESEGGRVPRKALTASSPTAPPTPPTASPAAMAAPSATVTPRRAFETMFHGSAALAKTAEITRSKSDGSVTGSHSRNPTVSSSTLGSSSSKTWPMSTLSTPSTSNWWDLLMRATRSPSSPSTRYISHSGRE